MGGAGDQLGRDPVGVGVGVVGQHAGRGHGDGGVLGDRGGVGERDRGVVDGGDDTDYRVAADARIARVAAYIEW